MRGSTPEGCGPSAYRDDLRHHHQLSVERHPNLSGRFGPVLSQLLDPRLTLDRLYFPSGTGSELSTCLGATARGYGMRTGLKKNEHHQHQQVNPVRTGTGLFPLCRTSRPSPVETNWSNVVPFGRLSRFVRFFTLKLTLYLQ